MSPIEPWGFGDVLMDCQPSGHEISVCLARILGLRPDEIDLIDDIERVLMQSASTKLICLRSVREGEQYPLLLSLWGTAKQTRPFTAIVAELCKALDCRCLINDGSIDPYSWLQLDGEGKTHLISYYGP